MSALCRDRDSASMLSCKSIGVHNMKYVPPGTRRRRDVAGTTDTDDCGVCWAAHRKLLLQRKSRDCPSTHTCPCATPRTRLTGDDDVCDRERLRPTCYAIDDHDGRMTPWVSASLNASIVTRTAVRRPTLQRV